MIASNLRRLMARNEWTFEALAEASDVDIRTLRSLLHCRRRPHARTLHKLAGGLGVSVDELFQPALAAEDGPHHAAAFDRATNPVALAAIAARPERFAGWTAQEVDELFSRVGTGGELNEAGVAAAVDLIESRRETLDMAAVILETEEGELLRGIVQMLYERVTDVEVVSR
jgi:transcriptional regulator with XRE-family HTH domain